MHLVCSLHLEAGAMSVRELQFFVYIPVRTVVVDEELCLFEVGSGGKRCVAVFWFAGGPIDTFAWTVDLSSRDNAGWAL